jgi:Tfp pilus assembly protein PilN
MSIDADPTALLKPRSKQWDALVTTLLGPNEDRLLPVFLPYTPKVNLLPPPAPLPWPVLTAIALGCATLLVATGWFALGWVIRTSEADLQQVQTMTQQRQAETKRLQTLQHQVDAIDAEKQAYDFVRKGSPRWSDILARLSMLTPEGIRFDKVSGLPDGTLFVDGKADSLTALGHLMVNMRGSGFFHHPKLGMGQRVQVAGGSVIQFDLGVSVQPGEWLENPEYMALSRTASPSTPASSGVTP